MKTTEDLLAALSRGEHIDYLFFWGHRPRADGSIGSSCMSQWFEAPFEADGCRFATAEHYMMAGKAALFGDGAAREQILAAADPGKAKALGRKVKGFDEALWLQHRWDIVVNANRLKFSQNPRLGRFLLSTGSQVLVEASPLDTIWGIGLAADAPQAREPAAWRGLNLLGFALMQVRSALAVAA